jgi:ABC-type nitrate/sulfonate/bicarbonate transport system substrate-binding protein
MEKNRTDRKKRFTAVFLLGSMLMTFAMPLQSAERIYTAYFSPAPGASAVIWVAKEARLFEKHGLDVAPVLIPSRL